MTDDVFDLAHMQQIQACRAVGHAVGTVAARDPHRSRTALQHLAVDVAALGIRRVLTMREERTVFGCAVLRDLVMLAIELADDRTVWFVGRGGLRRGAFADYRGPQRGVVIEAASFARLDRERLVHHATSVQIAVVDIVVRSIA